MEFKTMRNWGIVWFLAISLLLSAGGFAQESGGNVFSQAELEQLLAPIALYPDSLLTQILMASTYPLEIVQADRWARQNQSLKGDALTAALEKQSWDPSVKSLVNFPQVLQMMSEKLDLTQKLGDAFLAQQKDVMDTVQKLRAKAQAEGNLKTTQEQKVVVQEKVIVIESADPQVVYVPTYNPTVVYGAWAYPAYPPYPYYPPGYVAGTAAFSFAAGVAVGAAWGYAWGNSDWHHGDVNINVDNNYNLNKNINREQYKQQYQAKGQINQTGQGNWQHDASHRKGVAYKDSATAQKFNRGTTTEAARSREQFRGKAEQGRQELSRGGAEQFASREASRQGAGLGKQERSRGGAEQFAGTQGPKQRTTAFDGMDRGKGATQSFSKRGSVSRGSKSGGGRRK